MSTQSPVTCACTIFGGQNNNAMPIKQSALNRAMDAVHSTAVYEGAGYGDLIVKLCKTIGRNRGYADNLPDEGWLLISADVKVGFSTTDGSRPSTEKKDVFCVFKAGYVKDIDDLSKIIGKEVSVGSFYHSGYTVSPVFKDKDTGEVKMDWNRAAELGSRGQEVILNILENLNDEAKEFAESFLRKGTPDSDRVHTLFAGKAIHYETAESPVYGLIPRKGLTKANATPADIRELKVRYITEIKDLDEVLEDDSTVTE